MVSKEAGSASRGLCSRAFRFWAEQARRRTSRFQGPTLAVDLTRAKPSHRIHWRPVAFAIYNDYKAMLLAAEPIATVRLNVEAIDAPSQASFVSLPIKSPPWVSRICTRVSQSAGPSDLRVTRKRSTRSPAANGSGDMPRSSSWNRAFRPQLTQPSPPLPTAYAGNQAVRASPIMIGYRIFPISGYASKKAFSSSTVVNQNIPAAFSIA